MLTTFSMLENLKKKSTILSWKWSIKNIKDIFTHYNNIDLLCVILNDSSEWCTILFRVVLRFPTFKKISDKPVYKRHVYFKYFENVQLWMWVIKVEKRRGGCVVLVFFFWRRLIICCLPFQHFSHQLFGRIEDSIGLLVTNVAALRLAVVLQGTGFTKIVPAPEKQRILLNWESPY